MRLVMGESFLIILDQAVERALPGGLGVAQTATRGPLALSCAPRVYRADVAAFSNKATGRRRPFLPCPKQMVAPVRKTARHSRTLPPESGGEPGSQNRDAVRIIADSGSGARAGASAMPGQEQHQPQRHDRSDQQRYG